MQQSLSDKEKDYQDYLESINRWKEKQVQIVGEDRVPDTIKFYQRWILFIDKELQVNLNGLYEQRAKIAKNIVELIFQKSKLFKDVFVHAQNYANKRSAEFGIPKEEFINFNYTIRVKKEFEADFLEHINQKRGGTFYRSDKGLEELKKIIKSINMNNEISIATIPERLIKALRHNLVDDPTGVDAKYAMLIDSQLLCESKAIIYNYLFSFDFLDVNFEITYAGKRIPSLSPGERGTLLLIFYLLIDKDKRPIVIDQPEENLDNETIYKRLVPFLKRVKNERQIIIVTHNPNLAVVCDSEQIIHSSIEKENRNRVIYSTGSIEFSHLREKVIDILEGTEDAFKNRQEKYGIK